MAEVKIYRVHGLMKIKNTWQKFTIELTATKTADAIERVYTWLCSRHKLTRRDIKILDVRIISLEEVRKKELTQLLMLDRIVKFY